MSISKTASHLNLAADFMDEGRHHVGFAILAKTIVNMGVERVKSIACDSVGDLAACAASYVIFTAIKRDPTQDFLTEAALTVRHLATHV